MKILVATSSYPVEKAPHAGVFVQRNVAALQARGILCTVLRPGPAASRDDVQEPATRLLEARVRSESCGAFLGRGLPEEMRSNPIRAGFDLLRCTRAMGRLLKSEVQKHDWILAHWALPAGFAANKAVRRTSGPGRLAVWCHSSDVYALERLPFGKYLARRCLDRAERFFVPSQDLAFRLTRLLGAARPIDVVHPGIELGPPPRPLPLGQFRVLFVGRLESIKGVKLVADLASRQPDWSFTMVGGGALESELKESSREIPNLNVIGPLPPEEIRAQLDAHHVLLLPGPEKGTKRSEGLPTVILEAFAAGRTVVAGDTGGSSEIVDESVGVLVPPGDIEACEEALSRLASDPSQLAVFSRAARSRSEAYDSKKIAEKIQTLLTRTS